MDIFDNTLCNRKGVKCEMFEKCTNNIFLVKQAFLKRFAQKRTKIKKVITKKNFDELNN